MNVVILTFINLTTNDLLSEITLKSLIAGKHVLVEKPGARCSSELKQIINLVKKNKKKVKVGFNHRYHPALMKAKEISSSGQLGDLMFVRGRPPAGHASRINWDGKPRGNVWSAATPDKFSEIILP